ncbi:haloacid dehalogenase [Amycolatopsis antarctica]|uniref:Haloacid dehalogenase n=1 Tax=Amycolatopsis antarctica TaxID=1854586 RepID=A0A263D2G6_9PSEU|nr:HAD family hydrolase [Amycolatopsis antarctica]OZM72662.1 haloacid dehalogenase [Amycolatopsis antarctica]
MTSARLADVIEGASCLLVDFDGPICSVFSEFSPAAVAQELRTRLAVPGMPETNEPFDVLSYVAEHHPSAAERAENELARLESVAVRGAEPTPAADSVLRRFGETSTPLVVVSNNSARCVHEYLARHELAQYVSAVSSRTASDPRLLKPHPHLLHKAAELAGRDVSHCVMIGDSATDIEAAQAVGAATVGYANKPGKRELFARLGADVIIDDMAALLSIHAARTD